MLQKVSEVSNIAENTIIIYHKSNFYNGSSRTNVKIHGNILAINSNKSPLIEFGILTVRQAMHMIETIKIKIKSIKLIMFFIDKISNYCNFQRVF